ncbi:MAG: gamma-glutamyltransferase, partial [Anaerolineales bacterium]|nr:gamma-glutamyltransferase [Anaerolineales bacterium]
YHTIIPAWVTRLVNWEIGNRELGRADAHSTDSQSTNPQLTESLFASFGVMGGFMQPQGHLQVFLSLAEGRDPQSALDLPRFCITDGTFGGVVALEAGIPAETVADLTRRGHQVQEVTGWERALFGRGQIILRDPESGVLTGGSDPRADGCAMTLA